MHLELQQTRDAPTEAVPAAPGLARYLTAAVLVRLADEGARVALVLLALDRTGSAAVGGLLVAALLVPHVLAAPVVGAVVDRVRQPRRVLAPAAAGLGLALTLTGLGLGHLPLPLVVSGLLLGGCCGPALTGALTSQLPALTDPQRLPRAFGLDSVTYNVSGIVGPALAAVVAGLASPLVAILVLAGSAVTAGLVLAAAPIPRRAVPEPGKQPPLTAGVAAMMRDRVLGVVTVASSVGQLGPGGLPVVAAVLAARQHHAAASGWLLTAVAAGGLVGSLLWTWRPARTGRAPQVVLLSMVGTGGCLALSAAATSLPVTAVLFVASGIFLGPFTGALFTVRQDRAPQAVRAQVFALGAGLKTSATAAGAALAGGLAHLATPVQLLAVGGLPVAAATVGAVALSVGRRRE